MAKRKLIVNATEEQLDKLYGAFSVGTPITIACSMAGISLSTYYYWVAIYSIVVYCKEQEELEKLEDLANAGISIQDIKDMTALASEGHRKSSIGMYIEPKQEGILQYKNNVSFRHFADDVYDIINKCNEIRSKVVVKNLKNIYESTTNKNIKASGSMWFLERTQPDHFGRPSDKAVEEQNTSGAIPSIQVEFINPNDDASKDRLMEMENKVLKELKGSGDA